MTRQSATGITRHGRRGGKGRPVISRPPMASAIYCRDACVIDGDLGEVDRSLESTAGYRVSSRYDARCAETLQSAAQLLGSANGPIWTRRQSATGRTGEVDCSPDDK